MRGRIKEDDISAPERKGPYYYYQRTLKGKEYVQHCRRLIPNFEAEAPLSVYDTMPTGPDAPPEHVILDENIKAQNHDYYSIAAFKVTTTMVYMIITDIAVVSCLIIQSSPLCCNCFFRLVQIINWWHMQKTPKEMKFIQFMSLMLRQVLLWDCL